MPRTEKSVTLLIGMIIGALYVIMLVGFSRESTMRRNAAVRADTCNGALALNDVAKRACRIEGSICGAYVASAGGRVNCTGSVEIAGQAGGNGVYRLTSESSTPAPPPRRPGPSRDTPKNRTKPEGE